MNKNENGKSCNMLSENTDALMTVYVDYDWIRLVMVVSKVYLGSMVRLLVFVGYCYSSCCY